LEQPSFTRKTNSFGLVFEPDLFDVYQYEDFEGRSFIGTERSKRFSLEKNGSLSEANPLFTFLTTPNWTLIPSSVFREEDKQTYLKLNTSFEEENECLHEEITALGVVLIYENDTKATRLVEERFPGLAIQHVAVPFILHSRERGKEKGGNTLNIWAFENYAKVMVSRDGEILLANCVSSNQSVDIVYFILYALKQLDIPNSVDTEMHGTGSIAKSTAEELSKYLSHFHWHGKQSSLDLSKILSPCAS